MELLNSAPYNEIMSLLFFPLDALQVVPTLTQKSFLFTEMNKAKQMRVSYIHAHTETYYYIQ